MPPQKRHLYSSRASGSHSKKQNKSEGSDMPPQKRRRISAMCSKMKEKRTGVLSDSDNENALTSNIVKLPSVASKASIMYKNRRLFGPKIYLFVDIETGGFLRTPKLLSDILQIAAVSSCKEKNDFNQYLLPTKAIAPHASKVNHLSSKKGELLYKDKRVDAVKPRAGFKRFLTYLKDLKDPHYSNHIILVSHNAPFDLGFLKIHLAKFGLWYAFTELVSGYIDSLKVFKDMFPGKASYKLENLVLDFTGDNFHAHEALADATMLKNLSALLYDGFPKHTFIFDDVTEP